MQKLNTQPMSSEFVECWKAAGRHLNGQVSGGIGAWLRAHPYPPFLEHLSFRLGNQLFFVRVEDAAKKVEGPGSTSGLLAVANRTSGHPCILPMRRKLLSSEWVATNEGWGLLDANTRAPISPPSMVTSDQVEMTGWELHDMAVQVVRDHLRECGFKLMSWQSNPDVDPAIWFVGVSGPEWVVVRPAIFPATQAEKPETLPQIKEQCAALGRIGHFASVSLASTEQKFMDPREPSVPLFRGGGMYVRFEGIQSVV